MAKKQFKNILQKDTAETTRTFKYVLNETNLAFNLRVDIKKDLKDFRELLKAALIDVTAELAKK